MKRLTLAAALALAGCSAPQAIQLRDGQTGAAVECKADPWAVWGWDIKRWQEECAQRYERNGYRRMN